MSFDVTSFSYTTPPPFLEEAIRSIPFATAKEIHLEEVDFTALEGVFEEVMRKISAAKYDRLLYVKRGNLSDLQWARLVGLKEKEEHADLQIFPKDSFATSSEVHLEHVDFVKHKEQFEIVLQEVVQTGFNRWLYVRKELLTDQQWQALSRLCNTNRLKGLQVYAADFFCGVVPGYLHMNQTRYNEAKSFIAEYQVRWTLQQALERYFPKMAIESVFDFGAGLSPELLYLTKNFAKLERIVAADFDLSQLEKLREAFDPPYREKLETFGGAFINYEGSGRFDLFLSSFTFPYRAPDQFPAVWEKAVGMTRPGGVMAFHLFGKPATPLADMTYHRQKEIMKLLAPICSEFEILVEYADGSCLFVYWMNGVEKHSRKQVLFEPHDFHKTDIYGGEHPEWGKLYHIVAKLK